MSQVYRGCAQLVHIEDGHRAVMGRELATQLDFAIRQRAAEVQEDESTGNPWNDPLCPGCYMVAVFNCAVELARRNGQSLTELGNSLAGAFKLLADSPDDHNVIESIEVQLDACQL
jgi:hypothetical protein